MKNLLIFFSPTHSFDNPLPRLTNDAAALIKVQIDNSLALHWKREDILLFTNFDYRYRSVRATVINDSEFNKQELEYIKEHPRFTRFVAIKKLFEKGLIEDDIYWSHDFDAFQLEPITESELELGICDVGAVDFDDDPKGNISWNTGSLFFRPTAKDICLRVLELMYSKNLYEQDALNQLTLSDDSIKKRIRKLNSTYYIKRFNFEDRYKKAIKPVKVAHFHPIYWWGFRAIDKFMGENSLGVSLIPKRLTKIFKAHGIS